MIAGSTYLADVLVRRTSLEIEQMAELMEKSADRNVPLLELIAASHLLEEEEIVRALAAEVGMPLLEKIRAEDVPTELIAAVPINFARLHRVLPISETNGVVLAAVSDPLDPVPLDDLRALLGKPVKAAAAPGNVISDTINRVYERRDETALAESLEGDEEEELQDLIDMADEAPVIRWVNSLFYNAVRERASDIHIEPADKEVIVRYRIDGDLYPIKTAHKGFLPSIVSRVKIEAGLNIAEKRLPQDGRITKKIAGKLIDVRVSTIPTAKGERIVMRLLDKAQILLNLSDLGFNESQLSTMEHLISRPNGIILVTGPTGAGKTTTLYACLNKVNTPDLNILTVEDPVEYELPGIGQMQIQPKIGLSFASGLRSFLRQDPDVIMVGEIRDPETAEIAIHASLTGHLVFSTLHTNDASSAVTRLVEMGIQSFLISSSLLAVLAQRLVRKLCPMCRQPYTPSEEDLRSLGVNLSTLPKRAGLIVTGGAYPGLADPPVFYRSTGCEACSGTGYRGRIGIYELLPIDEAIRRDVLNSSDSKTIQRTAMARGMISLREDGARQVVSGMTSVDEVLAATQAGELE